MSENIYALERLLASRRVENAIEAHRDHVGAAVARATNQRQSRLQEVASLLRASLPTLFGMHTRADARLAA